MARKHLGKNVADEYYTAVWFDEKGLVRHYDKNKEFKTKKEVIAFLNLQPEARKGYVKVVITVDIYQTI